MARYNDDKGIRDDVSIETGSAQLPAPEVDAEVENAEGLEDAEGVEDDTAV